jgi:hypothetical protein
MSTSREENAGQNHNIKRANNPFENVAKFKYMETTLKKIETACIKKFNAA